ncbi:hypothetical protein [Cognatilysobacter bugurensis]|uniref:Uncharacterized protein n=1 Tax=Cognatilysobacter bugurensis TaxID=543356 RepID=A0A918ST29_9GAMM|nr:hypothetical protein [Lysobacter bugurensis]GHA69437.1 hypothetical protein GCM10007067_01720 [Lysobacter bugurensis]
MAVLFAVGACTQPDLRAKQAATAQTPVEIRLAPGEHAPLPGGGRLRFVAVVSDSRCPPKVQCIHAGEAVLRFELDSSVGARTVELSTATDAHAASVGGHRVRLISATQGTPVSARVAVGPFD